MAKIPPSKQTPAQKRFKAAAVAANVKCIPESNTRAAFNKCRSTAMKAALKGKGKAKAARKGKATSKAACTGLVKSGPKKGRLKKGYRWKKGGGGCPVKIAA